MSTMNLRGVGASTQMFVLAITLMVICLGGDLRKSIASDEKEGTGRSLRDPIEPFIAEHHLVVRNIVIQYDKDKMVVLTSIENGSEVDVELVANDIDLRYGHVDLSFRHVNPNLPRQWSSNTKSTPDLADLEKSQIIRLKPRHVFGRIVDIPIGLTDALPTDRLEDVIKGLRGSLSLKIRSRQAERGSFKVSKIRGEVIWLAELVDMELTSKSIREFQLHRSMMESK